ISRLKSSWAGFKLRHERPAAASAARSRSAALVHRRAGHCRRKFRPRLRPLQKLSVPRTRALAATLLPPHPPHFQNPNHRLRNHPGQRPARFQSLSYVDILIISSITPAIFVAKREVSGWPVFGPLARMGGTLFVDRGRRTLVGKTTDEIQSALDQGALV